MIAEFPFTNASSKTVRVIAVRPNCDCLIAAADKPSYEPGESGVVRAEFALGAREGRQERAITVETDTSPSQVVTLKLMIDIPEIVSIMPRFLFWRLGDKMQEKTIDVTVAVPEETLVESVQCAEPAFTVQLVRSDEAGRYRVKVTPATTEKVVQATLRLNAIIAGQPRVFVLYAAVK